MKAAEEKSFLSLDDLRWELFIIPITMNELIDDFFFTLFITFSKEKSIAKEG